MNARPSTPDPRIPVLLLSGPQTPTATDAVLIEGRGVDAPNRAFFQAPNTPQHAAGCTCCRPRNPAGVAMAALLFAEARGQSPPFTRLLAITTTQAGEASIHHALTQDPVIKARFRLIQTTPLQAPPKAPS